MFWNKKDPLGWYGSKLNDYGSALQSGDYSAIPWVFCVLTENHAAGKTAAADILCTALEKMTFDDLVRVDEQMRQTTSMEWSIDWRKLSINSFFTPEMSEDARRAVIVFASFNPNGFIRERAVYMMKDFAGTLPFAILRQHDWVSQVRDAAGEAADYRLSHLAPGELIAALPFADKLSRSGRVQNAGTHIKHIYTALTSKDNEAELAAGLGSANIRTRRICTTALFNLDNPKYDLAVDRLKFETDPFLRANIFRRFMSTDQNLDMISEQFLTDKYPLNRMLAFQYVCGTDQPNVIKIAEKLLLDKSAAVREVVRFYLNKNAPGFDYRDYYKSHLDKCTAPAILGLGETGAAEDVGEIENYLKSAQISIVRAAMTALMWLDSGKYVEAITDFLSDDRVGIVKTARNLIIKNAVPDYARVMEVFRNTPYLNTKQKCFSVLLMASKWQRLIFILEALETGGKITEPANVALDRWIESYNRSYVSATPAQIEIITESIQRLGRRLPARAQRQLLFLLR